MEDFWLRKLDNYEIKMNGARTSFLGEDEKFDFGHVEFELPV